ncbi:MAG: methylmalonyl-CoA mutase family protein [Kofleriaceae bacterium]
MASDPLVTPTPEGITIQPLYTERGAEPAPPGMAPYVRGASSVPGARAFDVCMRADATTIADELAGGADAVWVRFGDRDTINAALGHGLAVVMDVSGMALVEHFKAVMHARTAWLGFDPLDEVWRGELDPTALPGRLVQLAGFTQRIVYQHQKGALGAQGHKVRAMRVSSLVFHAAGADAADELALVLGKAVAYLRACVREGLGLAESAANLWVQVAVGRDTFGELCKLRALRLLWWKLLAAAGLTELPLDALHAVCSPRTQALRDPWVNMLRVTTEVFAAVLGGAQMIAPIAFDDVYGAPSALGQRTARNTALVLREESHLGKVLDAGGGSYYLEARTEALAREAWDRFTMIERAGGLVAQLPAIRARLDQSWQARAALLAKRKEPVLGVSEFANLDEHLPAALPAQVAPHRDAEAFEALRARGETQPAVVLVPLGPPAEYRARLGFAKGLFAVAGLATEEVAAVVAAGAHAIACLCGSDERYATDAVTTAKALREAGFAHVVLAGRGGALEKSLKEAGVDGFIFMGCDVVATLNALTGGPA